MILTQLLALENLINVIIFGVYIHLIKGHLNTYARKERTNMKTLRLAPLLLFMTVQQSLSSKRVFLFSMKLHLSYYFYVHNRTSSLAIMIRSNSMSTRLLRVYFMYLSLNVLRSSLSS